MRGRPKTQVPNPYKEMIFEQWIEKDERTTWPLWLDDIVSGVARLDWYGDRDNQIPLSTVRIIQCLTILDIITTESVMGLLEIGKSQAKLYVKACSLCLPLISKSLADRRILRMHYPSNTIVSYEHGLSLGYDKQCKSKIVGF